MYSASWISFFLALIPISVALVPQTWKYGAFDVSYSSTSSTTPTPSSTQPTLPLLLLNGFGVGQFYQERLVDELSTPDSGLSPIYTLDYLGQGSSWPREVPPSAALDDVGTSASEKGLRYGVEDWADQILTFIDEVMIVPEGNGRIAIGGNSVGGHIAYVLAARYPEKIDTIVLFNATPVWGGLGAKLPSFISSWDGVLPAPKLERAVGKFLYDRIRDPTNVRALMAECYHHPDSYDGVVEGIVEAASNDGGLAAFGSILFSPGFPEVCDFYKLFDEHSDTSHISILGVYGESDPWIDPRLAKHLFGSFKSVRRRTLVTLSAAAHCPNNEAPVACATLLKRFVKGESITSCADESFAEKHYDGSNIATHVKDFAQSAAATAFCETLQYLAAY